MPEISTTSAQLLDIPIQFEYKGKIWQVSRIVTYEMEAELADWVFQQALARVERLRVMGSIPGGRGVNPVQYRAMMERLADNLAAGRFEWEGDLTIAAMDGWPGNKRMTLLRFQRYDPTVTMDFINELFNSQEDARRLNQMLSPSKPSVNGQKKESDEIPGGSS